VRSVVRSWLWLKKTLLLLSLSLIGCSPDLTVVSEGSRVGTVTKLSHKMVTNCLSSSGTWTWEGELSMASGTKAASQGTDSEGNQTAVGAWAFSVPQGPQTNDLVNQLKTGMDNGHTLRVNYSQVRSHDSCRSETDYNVVGVRDLSAASSDK
jgi:hypothetical protein